MIQFWYIFFKKKKNSTSTSLDGLWNVNLRLYHSPSAFLPKSIQDPFTSHQSQSLSLQCLTVYYCQWPFRTLKSSQSHSTNLIIYIYIYIRVKLCQSITSTYVLPHHSPHDFTRPSIWNPIESVGSHSRYLKCEKLNSPNPVFFNKLLLYLSPHQWPHQSKGIGVWSNSFISHTHSQRTRPHLTFDAETHQRS